MTAESHPLAGVRVLTLGGIGPVPFAAMLLADMGADVTRIERPGPKDPETEAAHTILNRGTTALECDLKRERGTVADLIRGSDIVLEGFRPGVVEKLGLGPAEAAELNPAVVYGRMTGWGQSGPYAAKAGHDINYIAVSGALEPIAGADGTPVPPLNMLGDFGGGALYLVTGVLAGLHRARLSGTGTVVDAAIVDGAAHLGAMTNSLRATGRWGPRGSNWLDGGAPWYRVYRTADDRFVSVGALEAPFYAELLRVLGLDGEVGVDDQFDTAQWPDLTRVFAKIFAAKTRAEWIDAFSGVDACFAEVVAPGEVLEHPHLGARGTYAQQAGAVQPQPAPRFSPLPPSG
ncbi:CaiB/BaiF CoA-transferase family protein [uncultured Corynebacterium sp.]|uniref:CaiB/BaiF CoA transferase family protein n=1 Tax=uncultured Corynebacterium sp. TaxID=159447 RepID=UPI0025993516|nr:CaiB/BaiF CoA-transferase family protein [uncultured Corynebacterium sp.]